MLRAEGKVPRLLRRVSQPILIGQCASVLIALVQMVLFARYMPVNEFAVFSFSTALWTMGTALIGSSIGTRVLSDQARSNSGRLSVSRRELVSVVAAAGASWGFSYLYNPNPIQASLISIALLAFIVAEVGSYNSLAQGLRWRYASCLMVRNAGGPLAGLVTFFIAGEFTLSSVLLGIIASNGIVTFLQISRTPLIISGNAPGRVGFVGATNLLLWVVAAGDRVVLGFTVDPSQLATYSLIYGIVDRIFRTPTTTYVSSTLPNVLRGERQPRRLQYRMILLGVGVLSAVAASPICNLISGGNYHVGYELSALLVLALLCYSWAAPPYIDCIAASRVGILFSCLAVIVTGAFLILWFVTPVIGIEGAALIKLVCYSLWFGAAVLVARRRVAGF